MKILVLTSDEEEFNRFMRINIKKITKDYEPVQVKSLEELESQKNSKYIIIKDRNYTFTHRGYWFNRIVEKNRLKMYCKFYDK